MGAPTAGRQRADRGWADERILGRGDFVAEMRLGGGAPGPVAAAPDAVPARALAVHLVTRLGLSLAEATRHLGVSTSGIAKAVDRAEAQ